jgi:hypothetical protein
MGVYTRRRRTNLISAHICLSNFIHPSIRPSVPPSVHPSIYGSTALLLDLGRFFSFLILYTVGRTTWTRDQPVARPLPAHRTAQTQNTSTQTSTPQVRFESTIPMFERAKTAHALDRAVTVIGISVYYFT